MRNLVEELQFKAFDKQTSISELLRLARIVSVKLDLEDFQQWISNELNGYKGDVPDYRRLRGQLMGVNPFHGMIPAMFSDDEIAELVAMRDVRQRIAEIEVLASHEDGQLSMPLSDEQQLMLRRAFHQNMEFRLVFQSVSMLGIVDAVRNVILDWGLTLEKNGIRGEGMTFSREDKEKANDQVVHYRIDRIENFTGALGNISGGQVNATTTVIKVEEVEKLLTQIESNMDGFRLKRVDKEKVVETVGEIRASVKSGSFSSHGVALLSVLKGIFEHATGDLLAAGILHELGRILG